MADMCEVVAHVERDHRDSGRIPSVSATPWLYETGADRRLCVQAVWRLDDRLSRRANSYQPWAGWVARPPPEKEAASRLVSDGRGQPGREFAGERGERQGAVAKDGVVERPEVEP